MFKVNSRNTKRRCDMFRVNKNDGSAITSFCSGVDKVSQHKFPANIYLFKVNNIDTRIRCEICSKLTMKTKKTR